MDIESLYEACAEGNVQGVQDILDSGEVDPNDRHPVHGKTPLQISCQNGKIESVRVLLESTKSLHYESDNRDEKPLRLAVEHGHWGIVDLLINTYGLVKALGVVNLMSFHILLEKT